MQERTVVVVDAMRTAVGSFNGSLASLNAAGLGEVVVRALLERNKVKPEEIILGQVLTAANYQNPARQVAINAGLDINTPAWLVNQVCGSGLKAVALAYQSIITGNSDIVIAGGQESMSQAPHAIYMRSGLKMGDGKLIDTMMCDGLTDAFQKYSMGITAENIAEKFNITRADQDEFSAHSQNKAEKAQKEGKFKDEIIPVTIKERKGEKIVDQDEFIRYDVTAESLSKLRPAFKSDGTVTAGNASGINDGAAMLLVMELKKAEALGLTPLAKIVSWGDAGVDPAIMGTGPIKATQKALSRAGWQINDLDLIEANEAFAAQAISVNRELGWDVEKVNVNGGAIAIGHPIGASGARIAVTLLHEMRRRQAKKTIATLCIGGGMGIAMCFEKI